MHVIHPPSAVALAAVLLCQSPWALALPAADQQTIAAAAARTQEQCFKLMYRDTNAYAQCVRNLRDAESSSNLKKLGIEYFGFVGALSYVRVGHLNSSQIASEFLSGFRQTQKKVGISEAALCSTVPGDCTVRIAQTREMQATPPPKQHSLRMQCMDSICKLVPVP
jgi:hypothetical protein